MDYLLRAYRTHTPADSKSRIVLGGDVGGTNTTIALAWAGERQVSLVASFRFRTQGLRDLFFPMQEAITYGRKRLGVQVEVASIGLAGPVLRGKAYQLTNSPLLIDPKSLERRLGLKHLHLMNDFAAIGYGVNFLKRADFLRMPSRRPSKRGATPEVQVVIGAGTGLGKSILIYDPMRGLYLPHASEGGNADFPVTEEWEWDLMNFIRGQESNRRTISYEDILSGRGLERIYQFLRKRSPASSSSVSRLIDGAQDQASLISQYLDQDQLCEEAFSLFLRLYGKCARNFALDTLSLGGVYLAGGILARNISHIHPESFRQVFEEHDRHSEILRRIPIWVITCYEVSLYGAAFAADLFG